MPFVQRVIEPKFVSRTSLRNSEGQPLISDEELQAVTNCTLSNALKQLASLVILANDIFNDLTLNLNDVTDRSKSLQVKIGRIGEIVEKYDPKKVTVPEDSLSNFAARKVHYTAKTPQRKELFTPDTRPHCLRDLYDNAGNVVFPSALLDEMRNLPPVPGYLWCTPVLGSKRRKIRGRVDVEIETRIPAAVEDLRKWTSTEALGDMTVLPDPSSRIPSNLTLLCAPDDRDVTDYVSGDEEPIDHQLPSPEEQLEVIIAKFPPEVVPIDTSGKFFDRMCNSRKSLLHIEASLPETPAEGISDSVKRRTRSRKTRGKRRNTISGTDQKELREAIAGDASSPVGSSESPDSGAVMRSHSSDLLKTSPIDPYSKKSSHFNSLKLWGKTRLRMMSRSPSVGRENSRDQSKTEKIQRSKSPVVEDIDDVNIYETVRRRRNVERQQDRMSMHQRNGSYSSSDKSVGIPVSVPTATATVGTAVKLRESSAQKRLRRSAVGREEPHSSSGNWSASSESGRASIGSEITTTTVPPRSTTTTSLNSLSTHGPGPPSSIASRRRFLNTSTSGSVTSDAGTLTPDIIHDLHDDLETSSEYSCDTEGYYTSFHMDSGLKTLKEEELPSTPLHSTNTLTNSSGNQTVLSAENEYELFGKGSTSTTTSSAGTVCTTLMAGGSNRSLVIGPAVPERKSSLTRLHKSKNTNTVSSANASLDRNFTHSDKENRNTTNHSSPRVDTKKLNYSSPNIANVTNHNITVPSNVRESKKKVVAQVHSAPECDVFSKNNGTDSPDSGHNTSSSPIEDSISSAPGKQETSLSEQDYSESSDLEGTDRIERIRVKTAINSSRIPSMCVITPTNSDDESVVSCNQSMSSKKGNTNTENEIKADVTNKTRPKLHLPNQIITPSYPTVKTTQKSPNQINMKNTLQPLNNLMCKLKGVLPHKLSMKKSPTLKESEVPESLYADSGDYVTIADVKNNNQKITMNKGSGVYYSNDVVKRNLQTVLSGKLHETEYVSLNELPHNISDPRDVTDRTETDASLTEQNFQRHGAKVTLDSHGKVIYSSDSMRRRKGAHTTFEPGPFVKDLPHTPTSPVPDITVKVRLGANEHFARSEAYHRQENTNIPLSPQLGKVIIRAASQPHEQSTTEVVLLPSPKPNTIITATLPDRRKDALGSILHTSPAVYRKTDSEKVATKGAYINIQDAEGVSLSPTKDNSTDYRHSNADQPPNLKISQLSTAPQQYIPSELKPSRTFPSEQTTTTSQSNDPNEHFKRVSHAYWTLPKKISNDLLQDHEYVHRSVTPDITRDLHYRTDSQSPSDLQTTENKLHRMPPNSAQNAYNLNRREPHQFQSQKQNNSTYNIPPYNSSTLPCSGNPVNDTSTSDKEVSLKISPIDPRSTQGFKSSTPAGKSTSIDLNSKLLSPVKSNMTNEELYAVIHKSKKKLNIKGEVERSGSPALSSVSISPVSSETSLNTKVTVKQPESGYLTDPRSRHSWAQAKDNLLTWNVPNAAVHPPSMSSSSAGSRQSWACSDRLGPPSQTSRLDFKKLLLQHGVKLNTLNPTRTSNKVSAVEQLKLSREKAHAAMPSVENVSKINILDLSGSPKTYANRRQMRPMPQPSSPNRTSALTKENKATPKILLSPKTQWRFSSPRSDVLSSPIPEAFNEEESPNSSGDKSSSPILQKPKITDSIPINTFRQFGARRNLIPINENALETESDFNVASSSKPAPNYSIEEKLGHDALSRSESLQAKRAQFFEQSAHPNTSSFSTFKSLTSPSLERPIPDLRKVNHKSRNSDLTVQRQRKSPSPPALETAL